MDTRFTVSLTCSIDLMAQALKFSRNRDAVAKTSWHLKGLFQPAAGSY